MIWLFLICLAVLAGVLEWKLAGWTLADLRYAASCDTLLAEPGQAVTFTSTVENQGLLPVLYIQLVEYLPAGAELQEDEAWIAEHVYSRAKELCVKDRTYLLPRRRRTSRLRFSMPQRGWYRLGGAVVSAGDFLGMRESSRQETPGGELVVIPSRCGAPDVLRTLGGFLGDISVRRFILADPILTVGFREYTGREPLKDISWTQTARSGRMLVKQYDYTVDVTVTVLLNAEGGTHAQLEQCYRLTRTVCEELEARGIPYAFRTNGDLIGPVDFVSFVSEGLGRRHLQTILYGLGRAHCLCMSSLESLVEKCIRSQRPNEGFLVVTPPLSPRQRALVDRLRGGGTVCVLTGEEDLP